jgi:hypothetical protein
MTEIEKPQELVALVDVHVKALPARNAEGVLIDPRVEVIAKGKVIEAGKLTPADIEAMLQNGHVAYRDIEQAAPAPGVHEAATVEVVEHAAASAEPEHAAE